MYVFLKDSQVHVFTNSRNHKYKLFMISFNNACSLYQTDNILKGKTYLLYESNSYIFYAINHQTHPGTIRTTLFHSMD